MKENTSRTEDEQEGEEEDEQEGEEVEEDDSMEIFVKIPHMNKTITLDVEPVDAIRSIKAMISGSQGVPRNQQRLIFADTQLEDNMTLASYSIQPGSTLTMAPFETNLIQYLVASSRYDIFYT